MFWRVFLFVIFKDLSVLFYLEVMASKPNDASYYFDIPSSPSGSPVIVDENCMEIFLFLKEKRMDVIAPKRGMADEKIKKLGFTKNAYIVTADRKGFSDYEKALYVYPCTRPDTVYRMLTTLINCERHCMREKMLRNL